MTANPKVGPFFSSFISEGPEDEPAEISEACWKFEEFLEERRYTRAIEICPIDNGELFGAKDAGDLAYEIIEKHPECESYWDKIFSHAGAIGLVARDG